MSSVFMSFTKYFFSTFAKNRFSAFAEYLRRLLLARHAP